MAIKWRKQYEDPKHDAELGFESAVVFDPEEDLTVQSYKDDSDINVLMRRFGVTGELPRASVEPFYGDFSEAVDYQTALNMVREAGDAFASLPAPVRSRFGNDPAELIGFLQDGKNREEAERLGLVPAKPAPVEPQPLPGASAAAPPKEAPPSE